MNSALYKYVLLLNNQSSVNQSGVMPWLYNIGNNIPGLMAALLDELLNYNNRYIGGGGGVLLVLFKLLL